MLLCKSNSIIALSVYICLFSCSSEIHAVDVPREMLASAVRVTLPMVMLRCHHHRFANVLILNDQASHVVVKTKFNYCFYVV